MSEFKTKSGNMTHSEAVDKYLTFSFKKSANV